MLNFELPDIRHLNRYDLPFRYMAMYDCYLVTVQKGHHAYPTIYEVSTIDRALPSGLVQSFGKKGLNQAYLYAPGHTGDLTKVEMLCSVHNLDTAVEAVLSAHSANLRRGMQK
jgi:hypothetical protein